MSKNSLLEAGAISEIEVTATRFEPATTWMVNKHSTICLRTKWLRVWISLRSLKLQWFFKAEIYGTVLLLSLKLSQTYDKANYSFIYYVNSDVTVSLDPLFFKTLVVLFHWWIRNPPVLILGQWITTSFKDHQVLVELIETQSRLSFFQKDL